MTLLDWCYSVTVESKKYIPAIVPSYAGLYPSEVKTKRAPMPSTDIAMLMRCLRDASAEVPKRFKGIFERCLADVSPASRPQDAWAVQDMWRKLAKEEYGAPIYRALVIPLS